VTADNSDTVRVPRAELLKWLEEIKELRRSAPKNT
jgi:hypothetical protein